MALSLRRIRTRLGFSPVYADRVAPTVTICIPAYRSEAFIQDTLRSLFNQTYCDFIVEIAVEPPVEAVRSACEPFLRDERLRIIDNPQVFGWAENIRSLLQRVTTRYFAILPHDDVLQPDYLATLIDKLMTRPEASVAYSDIVCFGHEAFRWSLHVKEEPIFDRLMSFFLAGAEADAFRGLTHSRVLEHRQFPTDEYEGFAVECEWVLYLLISGTALHVPRPLYSKRFFGPRRIAASAKRLIGHSKEHLADALENHRSRMLSLVRQADLPKTITDAVTLAAEAAMLRRHMNFNMGQFLPVQLARSEQILLSAGAMQDNYGKDIKAMCLLALSQNAWVGGDHKMALDLAIAAVEANPHQWEALAQLSKLQLNSNRGIEALDTAVRAWAIAPYARGLRELIVDCESNIEHRFAEIMLSGQAALLAERFDAAGYLIDNPDVAAAGVDPWKHYRETGWREGRKFRSLPRMPLGLRMY
jgi:Glycosyl transferase family 2